jgi:hypothetical protein
MKEKLFILLFLQFFFCVILSSGQSITFQKTFGTPSFGAGSWAQPTNDGGFVIVGTIHSSGSYDIYVIKTDSLGDTLWTKILTVLGNEAGYSIEQIHDGGYIISGYRTNSGPGGKDVFLIKLNISGNLVWSQAYGGTLDDIGRCTKETYDHGFITIGDTHSFGSWDSSYSDLYLVKTDSNGVLEWSTIFCGQYWEMGFSVDQTSDSGYIVSTNSESQIDGNDFLLIKFDAHGSYLWNKDYGSVSGYGYGYSVHQMSDGGFVVGGTSYFANPNDLFVARFDSTGIPIWGILFGDSLHDGGNCLQKCSDGGFVITGFSNRAWPKFEDVCLSKIDSSGNLLWTKTYGGNNHERAYSVQQANDGGYIIAGYSYSFDNGDAEIYVIKTDSAGNNACYEDNINFNVTQLQLGYSSPWICTMPVTSTSSAVVIQSWSPPSVNNLCFSNSIYSQTQNESDQMVFPNPFTTNIQVSKCGRLLLFNSLSQKLFETKITDPNESIDFSFLPKGIFFMRFEIKGKVFQEKIVKM